LGDRPVRSVYIGQLAAARGRAALGVYGLGSCVALILFDPGQGLGGLAHVLLPGPKPAGAAPGDLPAKYCTDALAALRAELAAMGAKERALRAALVGGARLFQSEVDLDQGIGTRNVEAIRLLLKRERIALAAEETGGEQGRTVVFELPECRLRVRTLRGGWTERELREGG
jgi:chemotaxis protein CheD